jgi:hypothetical protein
MAIEEAGPRLLTERVSLPYELLLAAMPPRHVEFLEFFENLKAYHRTPEALCVHAGLDPAIPDMRMQEHDTLLWGSDRFVECYSGDELVVYGHWGDALMDESGWPQPRIGRCTIGLDTIASGVLTAIRLPDRRVFQSSRHLGDS